jgi:hypothetical protein
MNLGDLATFIGGKIGMSDAATLAKIKGFALERYKQIYAAALWKDALSIYTLAVAADQSTVILPAHVAQFIGAKFDTERLIPVDQAFIFSSYPELWDNSGTPTHCSELAAIATKVMPLAAGELVKVKSSAAGDVAPAKVTLHGEDVNGDPQQEQVTLTGAALAASVNSYAVLYGFSKAATVGTITLRNAADSATLQTLLPGDTQRLHRRLRLHTIPSVALTLMVLAKRHPGTFVNDTDATALPSLCDQALQAYVHGDALEFQRQYGKAQGKFAEAIALEKAAKDRETYQSAQTARFTPGDPMAEGCNPGDFL